MIGRAEKNITIFTPYFDNTLLRLLNANAAVERDQVAIVTDISPDNALEMPYQLRAAKKALSQGISVLSLQGLHAKVLLIDGIQSSIGSQNFTERGRRNREASVLPDAMLGDSYFVKTLHEWRSEASKVTEDELDELLKQLTPFFRKHRKMHEVIQAEVNDVLARQAQKREAAFREQVKERQEQERKENILLREHLVELEQQSPIRLAQREVFATLRERTGYETLMVSSGGDLTNWESKNPDESYSPLSLDWLYFYPVIFADTNRMGFARIAKTRITYIRSGVHWFQDSRMSWMVGDVAAAVFISFPKPGTELINITAEIKTDDDHGSCEVDMSFNGKSVEIKDTRFSRGQSASQSAFDLFVSNITGTLLTSRDLLDAFLNKYLRRFPKYDRLERERKNVGEYFDQAWYRISVIEVQGNPLLVFKKH